MRVFWHQILPVHPAWPAEVASCFLLDHVEFGDDHVSRSPVVLTENHQYRVLPMDLEAGFSFLHCFRPLGSSSNFGLHTCRITSSSESRIIQPWILLLWTRREAGSFQLWCRGQLLINRGRGTGHTQPLAKVVVNALLDSFYTLGEKSHRFSGATGGGVRDHELFRKLTLLNDMKPLPGSPLFLDSSVSFSDWEGI